MKFRMTFRLWVLVIALLVALLAISPSFDKGVQVQSVEIGSEIYDAGLRTGEKIVSINGQEIETVEDYGRIVSEVFDGTEKRIDVETEDNSYTILTNQTLEITVEEMSRSKIKTGLDLRGGARALVKADVEINDNQLADLVSISRNRFNVYGLSDVNIKGISDLDGNKFMLVEIGGATPDDLETLIGQQGKFEAKIGNETVFIGGDKDVRDVCRNDATCASIQSCNGDDANGYFCNYAFYFYGHMSFSMLYDSVGCTAKCH